MVFAGTGAGQHRIAAPDGPRDHLCAAVGQFARHLGEKARRSRPSFLRGQTACQRQGSRCQVVVPASISLRGKQTLRYLPAILPSGPINTATL